MTDQPTSSQAKRLESLWAGDFGDAYTDRNAAAANHRRDFWFNLLEKYPVRNALEIGCNLGGNLTWIAKKLPPASVHGIDVNLKALRTLRQNVQDINASFALARDLPYRDRWFDLTFTMGVLIHQPEATLPLVMSEIVRCSRKYVFCGEYASKETVEVNYRGHEGALFKRDYGKLYAELFPELRLLETGFLSKDQGWDDVTWWLFERQ